MTIFDALVKAYTGKAGSTPDSEADMVLTGIYRHCLNSELEDVRGELRFLATVLAAAADEIEMHDPVEG